jgi:branched-subunit amino acid ABC-type transport system permease component
MGSNLLIISFAIVIVGGLGSIRGTIVSAVLLGVAYNIALVFYPIVANAIIFIVMGAVLILKPSGLFGGIQA